MLVSPELLAGSVASRRGAERRSSPAALAARYVCQVAAIQIGLRVTPGVGERPVHSEASDNAMVFIAAFAVASPVEKHCTRILRPAEQKMNSACSNGYILKLPTLSAVIDEPSVTAEAVHPD